MSEEEPNTPPPAEPRLLRHPGVVAALITALAAGLFGLLNTLIETRAPKPMESEAAFDFTSGPVSARLAEMQRALAHRIADKPDIDTRRRAITALITMSGEQPPETYYARANDMLTQYVKDNINERRSPGHQVEVDPRIPAYRPLDIIAAMEGLQAIRRSSGGRVQGVSLSSVDFHQINLEKLDLEGFYFGHADFTNAILSDCRCRGADFRHARLHGTAIWGTMETPADFREVNFLQADLTGSKWANVDFSGSNIEKAVGHRQVGLLADARGLTDAQRAMFK